ncbi:hypothetical protein HG536_0D01720 [Torulaspora globosa]|uniref:Uncharacterized protein n=1 Tax=Torulaspora globosa TaxID=48254 RepID=A0A7G3ZGL4_9SACH|nr:uncharacterized protein HG536_0D01720 [Torulaspora globosa]QLL32650.1 hypothetical protein HG536_0D01720 [Torulaspora globosa]
MTKRPDKVKKDSRLNLATPRRNWKRFDSVVQHRFKGRAVNISRDQARGTVRSRNYNSISRSGTGLDGKDSEALRWIESMIKRGRSILSSLTEEERAFQVEIEEARRRNSVHERLVENILTRGDEDTSRNGYGTDTSFKNINNALYNSFVDSEDVNLDYSREGDIARKAVGSPDAPAMPVDPSRLQSELFGEASDYDEQEQSATDANASSNYSPQESANDVVEVLSSTSEESELDQADIEENYKSEEGWDEDASDRIDEPGENLSDEEQDSITQLSNLEKAGHESQRDDEAMPFSDEGDREEKLASPLNREEENEQDFEVLSVEENSDNYSSDLDKDGRSSGALPRVEHTNEELSESDLADSNDEASTADVYDANLLRGSSPSSPADNRSQSFSPEVRGESSQGQKSSSIEADDFAELDDIDILGNQESNQHIDVSSAVDNLHDGSDHFMNNEDENQHVLDAFDYRIIAQEARISDALRNVKPSVGLKEDAFSSLDDKTDDNEEDVANETDTVQKDQACKEDPMTAVREADFCNDQVAGSKIVDTKLNSNDHSPSVIEIEIDEEAVERQRDDELDNSEDDRSSVNETTIYHSFNGTPDEAPLSRHPSQNVQQENIRYQIVFAESAYSTTSYEDNSNIVEPLTDYVSPLAENPFSMKQDEDAYKILEKTLASLSKKTEDQNGDDPSRYLGTSDRKTPVLDTVILSARSEENVGVDQKTVQSDIFSNNSDHLNRSNEEEVSDYVTAVLEASRKIESSSECETSAVAVEEIKSDIVMTSLPAIQTRPLIEVAESMPETLAQQAFDGEVRTAMTIVPESVGDTDSSEDSLSSVVQTRPIIEIPFFDRNEANSLSGINFAEQLPSVRTSPPGTQEDDSKPSESVSAAFIPCETEIPDDQEGTVESEASPPAASAMDSDQNPHEAPIKPDCTGKLPVQLAALSLPRRLLSSPLRAISSLVSGIKEVGNVASDFVKTLDVLDREDSESEPDCGVDSARSFDDDQKYTGMSENKTVPDLTEKKLQRSESLQYPESHEANKTSNVDDSASDEKDIYFACSTEKENATGEETVIHNVIDDVESLQVTEHNYEDKDSMGENQRPADPREGIQFRGPCTAIERSVTIEKTDNEQNEQEREEDDRGHIDLTEKEDIRNPEEPTSPSNHDADESVGPSPATAHETISHIRTLQQLADNVKHVFSTQQDKTEDSDLQSGETTTVDKVVNVEVDREIEIYLEKPSQDQGSLEFNVIPHNDTYPAESTMIGSTFASLQKDCQLTGPNRQEIEQDQAPPRLLHDHSTDKLPSYLPSDPPSESEIENAVEPAELMEDATSAKQSNDQPRSRSASIESDNSADCYIADQSAGEDVKSIPVESADGCSDVRVPVLLEATPPLGLEDTQNKEEETGSSVGESANAEPGEKMQSSTAKQTILAAKRKRPHDDAIDIGRHRKKNKRQLKSKRKSKKKGRIPSRKR